MNNKNMIMQSRITRKILLPYWKEFCDFNKANETAINSDQLSKLYRFRARHRLATKLVSIHAEGFSEQTLRGYTAALKLMFAYFSSRNTWKCTR